VAPLDSAQLKDFMDGLDPINALAEQAPGFVWRYTAEGTNNATAARPLGADDVIVNFGVWESRQHLWDFVYRSQHLDFLRRRHEQRVAHHAHDFEGGALGLARLEQVDGTERDAGLAGQGALTEQLALAECRQRQRWRLRHGQGTVYAQLQYTTNAVRMSSGI